MARDERVIFRRVMREWNVRAAPARSEIAYMAYVAVLIGLIVGAPIIRAAWVLLSMPASLATLALPSTGVIVAALIPLVGASVCAAWASPLTRAPFLAATLTSSPVSSSRSFRAPATQWLVLAVLVSVGATVLVQGVILAHGMTTTSAFFSVRASTAALAVVAWTLALHAQRSVRFALVAGAALAATSVFLVLTQPAAIGSLLTDPLGAATLVVIALVCLLTARASMNATAPEAIVAASQMRERALVGITLMNAGDAAAILREMPQVGRRLRASPSAPFVLAAPVSAMIGAARTPVRLARGLIVCALGLVLAGASTSVWTTVAAVSLIYAGLGSVTEGVRYAADVVRSAPAYGVSDATFFFAHSLFPLLVAVILSPIGAVFGGVAGWIFTLVLGLSAVAARAFAALSPEMPIELLMPIPTPLGDMAAMMRLIWGAQGLVFAGTLAGFATAALVDPTTTSLLFAVGAFALGAWALVARWRGRD